MESRSRTPRSPRRPFKRLQLLPPLAEGARRADVGRVVSRISNHLLRSEIPAADERCSLEMFFLLGVVVVSPPMRASPITRPRLPGPRFRLAALKFLIGPPLSAGRMRGNHAEDNKNTSVRNEAAAAAVNLTVSDKTAKEDAHYARYGHVRPQTGHANKHSSPLSKIVPRNNTGKTEEGRRTTSASARPFRCPPVKVSHRDRARHLNFTPSRNEREFRRKRLDHAKRVRS